MATPRTHFISEQTCSSRLLQRGFERPKTDRGTPNNLEPPSKITARRLLCASELQCLFLLLARKNVPVPTILGVANVPSTCLSSSSACGWNSSGLFIICSRRGFVLLELTNARHTPFSLRTAFLPRASVPWRFFGMVVATREYDGKRWYVRSRG